MANLLKITESDTYPNRKPEIMAKRYRMYKILLKYFKFAFRICCIPYKMVAGSMRVREPSEDSALRAELLRVREAHARSQKHDYSHVFRYFRYILTTFIYYLWFLFAINHPNWTIYAWFYYGYSYRRKSRFDLIRLTCIIVGIEFAYAAETAFVSPLLLEIGIEHKVSKYILF